MGYKDTTIEQLCNLINCLEDNGVLTPDESIAYRDIMSDYLSHKSKELQESQTLIPDMRRSSIVYHEAGEEEESVIEFLGDEAEPGYVLHRASNMICFDDCTDIRVDKIVVLGREVEYVGWQPGMLYEFRDVESGEIVFSRYYEQWDH